MVIRRPRAHDSRRVREFREVDRPSGDRAGARRRELDPHSHSGGEVLLSWFTSNKARAFYGAEVFVIVAKLYGQRRARNWTQTRLFPSEAL